MNYESMLSEDRVNRIKNLLNKKQPDLHIFMDNVHDSHNISAIIRSSEAIGLLELYYTSYDNRVMKIHKTITQGSHKWIEVTKIDNNNRLSFLEQKQKEGYQIVATSLSKSSISYTKIDYTKPTIVVVGNEKDGVDKDILNISNHQIIIPMVGMAQSLNVSVATAVILFEAKRQREEANMYNSTQLSKDEYTKLYNKWIRRDALLKRVKGRVKSINDFK